MKITSFHPSIVTNDSEKIMKLFEELGFEHTHTKDLINEEELTVKRMKNKDGFGLDVVQDDNMPRDLSAIRINVDDFDEAFELLKAHGFECARDGKVVETSSSKSVVMKAPSGLHIALIHHIKKG
jgi:adenylate cyclase class IV